MKLTKEEIEEIKILIELQKESIENWKRLKYYQEHGEFSDETRN